MYSNLATPSATKAVIERFGHTMKHSLGQNFLVNDAIIGKIINLSEVSHQDVVLEVGPGIGTLTCALLAYAKAVVSIEADRDLPLVLQETLAQDSDRFALIQADALKVDAYMVHEALAEQLSTMPDVGEPDMFIANLPYQVAATLILKYLQEMPHIWRLCVMVQKEVADRIAAKPSTKSYGAYTAKLGLYAEVTGRFEVGPHNFMPAPHVDSAVIRIDRKDTTLSAHQQQKVAQVIDAAFTLRRKTIRNSMATAGFEKESLDEAFEAAGISASCRAETLTTADFVRLAQAIDDLGR